MNRARSTPWLIALCVAASPLAMAQPSAATPEIGSPPVKQSPGGASYISGGAGSEERAAMDARRGEFPLKVVLSAGTGEYVVAEKLSLLTAQGPVLVARDAGPIVMIQAPPGSYTVEAVYQGKTERRTVKLAKTAQSVGFRFPG